MPCSCMGTSSLTTAPLYGGVTTKRCGPEAFRTSPWPTITAAPEFYWTPRRMCREDPANGLPLKYLKHGQNRCGWPAA